MAGRTRDMAAFGFKISCLLCTYERHTLLFERERVMLTLLVTSCYTSIPRTACRHESHSFMLLSHATCVPEIRSCLLTIAISRCWPRTLCAQGAMTYGSLSVSNIYLQMSEHAPPTRSRHLLPPLSPGAATRLESYTQLPRPTSGSLALASRLICCCCLSVKCPTIWCVAQLLPSCCRAAPLACE